MKTSYKPIVLDAEPDETTLIVTEIDNLIATAEARIERQREYVRSVGSDFEGSMKAITDLERMTFIARCAETTASANSSLGREASWEPLTARARPLGGRARMAIRTLGSACDELMNRVRSAE